LSAEQRLLPQTLPGDTRLVIPEVTVMKLFSYGPWPYAHRTRLVLAEKNIPYDLIECDLGNKPKDLLQLNPYGKVPVLVDGDAVVYESAIIDEYLEEKYPHVPLMPKDPLVRARIRIWIDYCNTRVQRAAGYIAHDYKIEESRAELRGYLENLNREMQGREYITPEYSLADITYIPFFVRRERYQVTIGDDLPHIKGWMKRLLDRPAVRAAP
jgi:glutathione S-transferase